MKNIFLTSAVLGSLTMVGCSSAYRSAQTPDDVYYSEGPPRTETVQKKESKEEPEGYSSYWERQDDNMLRMKVNDRDKWSEVDDIDYWQGYNNNYWVNYNTMYNSPWAYNSFNNPWYWNKPLGWGSGWGSSWSMNMGWNNWGIGYNSWYNNWTNPYCWSQPTKIINKFPVGSRTPGALNSFSNYTYNRGNSSLKGRNNNVSPGTSRSIWENYNGGSGNTGNSLYRSVTRPSNSGGNNNGSYERPVRMFDNGGGTNSGGSSNSGGGSRSSSGGSSSGGGSSRGGRGG